MTNSALFVLPVDRDLFAVKDLVIKYSVSNVRLRLSVMMIGVLIVVQNLFKWNQFYFLLNVLLTLDNASFPSKMKNKCMNITSFVPSSPQK